MCKNLSGGGCCVYRLDTLEREEASHEESQRQEHNKGLRQKEPSRTGRRPVVTELQQKGCMRWGGRGEERWNHPSNIGHDHKSGSHGKQICKPEKGFLQRSSVIWFTFSKKKKKSPALCFPIPTWGSVLCIKKVIWLLMNEVTTCSSLFKWVLAFACCPSIINSPFLSLS